MIRQVVLAAAVAMVAAPAFAQSAEKPVAATLPTPTQTSTAATTPLPPGPPAATELRQMGSGKSGCSWSSARAYPTS